jgi:hypothetical protein
MEGLMARVVSVVITAVVIVAVVGIGVAVGNLSGRLIRKMFGIGGK